MKKLMLGVFTGLLIGALGCFIAIPKVKESAHAEGYEKGIAEGTVKGIEQGKLEQKTYQDSLNTASKKKVEIRPKTNKAPVIPRDTVDPNNRNFRRNADGAWEEIK